MLKTAGVSRYAYNQGLDWWEDQYRAFQDGIEEAKPSWASISRKWTIEKPEWAGEVSRDVVTRSLNNLGRAYKNFFEHRADKPVHKKKSKGISFQLGPTYARVDGRYIYLSKIGRIKMREKLRFEGRISGYTVRKYAGRWYVTICVDTPDVVRKAPLTTVGVDVGLHNPAVASDGTKLVLPEEKLAKLERKLKNTQRALDRSRRNQKKGQKCSNRYKKLIERKQRIQQKKNNIRTDAVHKFTTTVCNNHAVVVTETLDIKGLKEKAPYRSFRRAYGNSLMRPVIEQISYKAVRHIQAPQYFPSTKRCSSCGAIKEAMPPDIRVYKCEHCGAVIDRDLNAAINLKEQPWVTG